MPSAKQWHIAENGTTKGPFGLADLRAMAASGAVTRASLVWSAGMEGWKAAVETELVEIFAQVPPPPPPPAF